MMNIYNIISVFWSIDHFNQNLVDKWTGIHAKCFFWQKM